MATQKVAPVQFRELLEGQDYEAMFLPIVEVTHQEGFVRRQVAEVRRILVKNDRIVWFLRLWRIGMLGHLEFTWKRSLPANVEVTALDKIANLRKFYEFQYSKASGQPAILANTRGQNIAAQPNHYLRRLEHFLSLPIPEIQDHVFRYDDPDVLFKNFTVYEDKWKQSRQGMIPQEHAEEGAEIVLQFPNGLAWWMLDRTYCQYEADAMGHCGNAGGRKTDRILSLRKIEKRGQQKFYSPYATFILREDGKLGEMKGRFNNSPKHAFEAGHSPSDFHDEIFALLKLPMITGIIGGGYMPQENFKVSDLPPEQIEALGEIKPQMLPLKVQYKKTGMTPDLADQIEAQVSHVRDITYDKATNAFIWDARADLQDFINRYVKVGRNHRTAMASYVLKVLEGDQSLDDYYPEDADDQKEDVLKDLQRKHPDEYAQLVTHIEKLWDEEHGDDEDRNPDDEDDYDERDDRPDLLEMIKEVDDELDSNLLTAVADGHQRGAENEMSKAFDKWIEHLKSPGEFWINLPEWDDKYYESACNVMVSTPHLIDMIDDGDVERHEDEDQLFEVKDIEEPYYGFQGYDEEAALEYLMDNLPEMYAGGPGTEAEQTLRP